MDYNKKIRIMVLRRFVLMVIIFFALAAGFVAFELGRYRGVTHAVECAVIMLAVYLFILWRVKLVQMAVDKKWEGEVESAVVRAVRGGKSFFTPAARRSYLCFILP